MCSKFDKRGFTLIELLVVIAIVALLSSVVMLSLSKARIKARNSQRMQNARQISLALEQYEQNANSYMIPNTGLNNTGGGFVAKGSETAGYSTSVLGALKSAGYYSSAKLIDPVYGTDNYFLGVCTTTRAYNVFVKLEGPEYNNATTSVSTFCGGAEASLLGFNYIAVTSGGSSGGEGGLSGAAEYGIPAGTPSAILSNLRVEVDGNDLTSTPPFSKTQFEYAYNLQADSVDLSIIVTKEDPSASVTATYNSAPLPFVSGGYSLDVSNPGIYFVVVTVTPTSGGNAVYLLAFAKS